MSDVDVPDASTVDSTAALLKGALIDSRQRWRELVNLSADFAFETDEWGRFTLITPDPALGWAAAALIGQPATSLVVGDSGTFNPFRVTGTVRHRQAWLRRGDAGIACLTFSAAPIRDSSGRVAGVRGSGTDMTEFDGQAARVAAALRRAELLDHILKEVAREIMAPRMMTAALRALSNALGADGAAVLNPPPALPAARLAHVVGTGADAVVDAMARQPPPSEDHLVQRREAGGRPVLTALCETRSGEKTNLIVWRAAGSRDWDEEEKELVGSAVNMVRMVLEHENTQQEMARQARTYPLTGLLNRRAFLEEIERHASRLRREEQPGTLIFVDLDHFKPVNDRMGHEIGDMVLRHTAALLRGSFRPGDLVARLGGDEFAVWMNGADHMTAAERAEYLRDAAPRQLAEVTGPDGPRLSMSIGIASRGANEEEALDSLIRRADMAMYEVKRGGRGHWRVSLKKRT
jgi:diguanylate cyclase (GGDEF)-like protein